MFFEKAQKNKFQIKKGGKREMKKKNEKMHEFFFS